MAKFRNRIDRFEAWLRNTSYGERAFHGVVSDILRLEGEQRAKAVNLLGMRIPPEECIKFMALAEQRGIPFNEFTSRTLLTAYNRCGQYEEAVAFDVEQKDNPLIVIQKAKALSALHRNEEALEVLAGIDRSDWDASYYQCAMYCLNGLGRYSEAIELISELAEDEWTAVIYGHVISVLFRQKKIEEASIVLTRAEDKYPDAPIIKDLRAMYLYMTGDSRGALTVLTQQEVWSARSFDTAALALNSQNMYNHSISVLDQLDRSRWTHYSYNAYATALNGVGDHEAAINLLEEFGRGNWNVHHYGTAATALRESGRPESSLQLLEEDLTRDRWEGSSYNNAAQALLQLGRGEEAERTWQDALDINPENAAANILYAKYLLDTHPRDPRVVQLTLSAVQRFTRSSAPMFMLAECVRREIYPMENYVELLDLCSGALSEVESKELLMHAQSGSLSAFEEAMSRYSRSGFFWALTLWKDPPEPVDRIAYHIARNKNTPNEDVLP